MNYLEIAQIVNTHGIHGELRLICNYYGQKYPNWTKGTVVYLKNNEQYEPLVIENCRLHKQFLLVTFKDYNNINLVEWMKTKQLFIKVVDENNLPWFYEDIIGYEVFDSETLQKLGIVISFFNNNHQGLWEIKQLNNKVFFVPNNEEFIIKIDQEKHQIFINVIEGLINNE